MKPMPFPRDHWYVAPEAIHAEPPMRVDIRIVDELHVSGKYQPLARIVLNRYSDIHA